MVKAGSHDRGPVTALCRSAKGYEPTATGTAEVTIPHAKAPSREGPGMTATTDAPTRERKLLAERVEAAGAITRLEVKMADLEERFGKLAELADQLETAVKAQGEALHPRGHPRSTRERFRPSVGPPVRTMQEEGLVGPAQIVVGGEASPDRRGSCVHQRGNWPARAMSEASAVTNASSPGIGKRTVYESVPFLPSCRRTAANRG